MQARIAPWQRGARWLGEGWMLFRSAPLGWLGAVFVYWVLVSVAGALPAVGVVLASVLVPPFTVGFMALARGVAATGAIDFGQLFDGFRHHLARQLTLGALYFACLAAVIGASALADGGTLARWMLAGARPTEEAMHAPGFAAALAAALALYVPVMLMYWFAPPLVAWHGVAPAKALFFSVVAAWLNRRAFLAYGAVVLFSLILVPYLLLSLMLLLLGGAAAPATTLVLPLVFVMLPTLQASFYVSYRDVFGAPPRDVAAPRQPLG